MYENLYVLIFIKKKDKIDNWGIIVYYFSINVSQHGLIFHFAFEGSTSWSISYSSHVCLPVFFGVFRSGFCLTLFYSWVSG